MKGHKMTFVISMILIIVGLLNHNPTPEAGVDSWLMLSVLGIGIITGRITGEIRR